MSAIPVIDEEIRECVDDDTDYVKVDLQCVASKGFKYILVSAIRSLFDEEEKKGDSHEVFR